MLVVVDPLLVEGLGRGRRLVEGVAVADPLVDDALVAEAGRELALAAELLAQVDAGLGGGALLVDVELALEAVGVGA